MRPKALVTGAGRRLGAHFAIGLAKAGWDLAIHYNSSETEAQGVAARVEAEGGRAMIFGCDLRDPQAVIALIPTIHSRYGAITAIINSASLFSYDTLDTLTPERLNTHLAVNLAAPLLLTQAFARQVLDGEVGVVVNILDQKVAAPNPDYFSYTAGKVALAGMTRAMALALAPRVRLCGISPGVTLPSGKQTADDFQRASAATPLGVSSTPDDLMAALLLILRTPSLTGQIITVDGGESLLHRERDVAYDSSV
jgi:NAD(P)-dependent dehydrogenase (short-subunit alcohol dehydrogenase family)